MTVEERARELQAQWVQDDAARAVRNESERQERIREFRRGMIAGKHRDWHAARCIQCLAALLGCNPAAVCSEAAQRQVWWR
jgi:hypothetical protein